MQRTAVVEWVKSGTRRNPFTDGLDERLQVLERGIGKHAVTQVEHMTRAAACAPEDVARSFDHQLTWAEEERRVEVALDAVGAAQLVPALVERDAPVERNDIRTGRSDQQKQAGGARSRSGTGLRSSCRTAGQPGRRPRPAPAGSRP